MEIEHRPAGIQGTALRLTPRYPGFTMKRTTLISWTAIIFLIMPIPCILAGNLLCATCGKPITGSYKVYLEKPYCSQSCLEDALPKCMVCGKPALKSIRQTGETEKIYCSLECFQTTLSKCEICAAPLIEWVIVNNHKYCGNCAKLPRCLNCRLPGAEKRLADGRHICSKCLETAVIDPEQAEKLFRQVRADIYTYLHLKTGHPIQLYLKDAGAFMSLVGNPSSTEQGYYQVRETYQIRRGVKSRVSGTYTIYVLSALSPPYFRNTAAHELAHDLGQELYPSVQKQEDVEGFAEYLSAIMNRHWGNDSLNQEKLENTEKEYAAAYKKFLEIGRKNGLRDVMDYMEKQNRAAGTR
jgi:hypothetical protein